MTKLFYPFSAIVGQERLKRALLLNIINPKIGGVLIQGEKGTAKTTSVRSLPNLMGNGVRIVELPIGATEDRVVGTINLKKVMKTGEKQFEPGILKEADGNILYADEVNLLDDHIVDLLLDAAATGMNFVERDGISYSHPSRFVLIGTMNPEEGTLRPQLLDRFGLSVQIQSDLSTQQRIEVLENRLQFEQNPQAFIEQYASRQESLTRQINRAVEMLDQVAVPAEMTRLCVELCSEINTAGYRGDITVIKTAMAIAALEGKEKIEEEDILEAAEYALPHRMKEAVAPNHSMMPLAQPIANKIEQEYQQKEVDSVANQPSPPQKTGMEARNIRADFLQQTEKKNNFGKRIKTQRAMTSGKCLGSTLEQDSNKPHPLDSVRAQLNAGETVSKGIHPQNIRYQKLKKRVGTLILFLVDTSGSMYAKKRMEFAKGYLFSLLKDAYIHRDRVAMITFGGERAQLVLPPTASKERAFELLQSIQTGGKTPMLDSFKKAMDLIGKENDLPVQVVLITDGKYNRSEAPNPEEKIKAFGDFCKKNKTEILVIDTNEEGIFALPLCQKIADLLQGRYTKQLLQ